MVLLVCQFSLCGWLGSNEVSTQSNVLAAPLPSDPSHPIQVFDADKPLRWCLFQNVETEAIRQTWVEFRIERLGMRHTVRSFVVALL